MTTPHLKTAQYSLLGQRLGHLTKGQRLASFLTRPRIATAGILTLFSAAAFAVAHFAPESIETARQFVASPSWFRAVAEPFLRDPMAVKMGALALACGSFVGAGFAKKQMGDVISDAEKKVNDEADDRINLSGLVVEKDRATDAVPAQRREFAQRIHAGSRSATKRLWLYSAAVLASVPLFGTGAVAALGLGMIAPMVFEQNASINRMNKVRHGVYRLVYRRREP